MKKAVKILLITAVCLVLIGGGAFCIVMAANDWDFNKLNSGKFETYGIPLSCHCHSRAGGGCKPGDISFIRIRSDHSFSQISGSIPFFKRWPEVVYLFTGGVIP